MFVDLNIVFSPDIFLYEGAKKKQINFYGTLLQVL